MTNKEGRLGRLEGIVDLELEARARGVLGLGEDSITWPELAREYRDVSERHAAIRERLPQPPEDANSLAHLEPEVRILAQDLGLDFEELMAEAERIIARASLDPQATIWLLSRLRVSGIPQPKCRAHHVKGR
jgi:hypothetical protein